MELFSAKPLAISPLKGTDVMHSEYDTAAVRGSGMSLTAGPKEGTVKGLLLRIDSSVDPRSGGVTDGTAGLFKECSRMVSIGARHIAQIELS